MQTPTRSHCECEKLKAIEANCTNKSTRSVYANPPLILPLAAFLFTPVSSLHPHFYLPPILSILVVPSLLISFLPVLPSSFSLSHPPHPLLSPTVVLIPSLSNPPPAVSSNLCSCLHLNSLFFFALFPLFPPFFLPFGLCFVIPVVF